MRPVSSPPYLFHGRGSALEGRLAVEFSKCFVAIFLMLLIVAVAFGCVFQPGFFQALC